jgi:hypothetical protein
MSGPPAAGPPVRSVLQQKASITEICVNQCNLRLILSVTRSGSERLCAIFVAT